MSTGVETHDAPPDSPTSVETAVDAPRPRVAPAAPGEKPLRLAEGLDVVPISDNEVLVQFGSRSQPSVLYRDTELTGVLGRVLTGLGAAPISRAAILDLVEPARRDELATLVDSLCEQGILVDAGCGPVEQYLGYVFTGDTRLATRRVALVGAGPVGAHVAELLLQHGVGRVQLLDGRRPDAIWRALARPIAAVPTGVSAQAALRDRLRALGYEGVLADDTGSVPANGSVPAKDGALAKDGAPATGAPSVGPIGVSLAALDAAAAEADLVILALERPDVRLAHLVNRVCLAAGRPWLLASLDGSIATAGPLFVPGVTACFNDLRALADAAGPNPLMARVYRQYAAERGADSFAPGLPAHASLVGGFAALAAVHTLLTGGCFLLGRTLTLNLDRMTIDVEDVLRLPRCPVCSRRRASYEPTFSAEVVTRVPDAPGS